MQTLTNETKRSVCLFYLAGMMVFFCTFANVQFAGRSLYLYLQLSLCIAGLLYYKRVCFCPGLWINGITVSIGLSTLSSILSQIPYSYQKAACFHALYSLIAYFSLAYLYCMMRSHQRLLPALLRVFKLAVIAQLLWIPLQYFAYHFLTLDLNKLIFSDLLRFRENASFIRSWVYYPSGFTWHSALLAPMFVLAYALFQRGWIRGLILFDAAICGNSTALVGTLACAGMLCLVWLWRNRKNSALLKKVALISLAGFVAGIAALACLGLLDNIWDVFVKLWMRLFGETKDPSTNAHLGYYSDYPKIAKEMSFTELLFGYGLGCSGWPITHMYGRYTDLESWAIESDIINILVSRGIVGFLIYYGLLAYIAVKGYRRDIKYPIVIAAIFLQGFGYNVQWDYMYMFEVILLFTLYLDVNFFTCMTDPIPDSVPSPQGEACDTPLVSVITMTYRNQHLLPTAIRSILSQDYPRLEVLVYDDGSPDFDAQRVHELLQEAGSNIEKISIFSQPQNVGTVRNYDAAIRASEGQIFVPLSCDDKFASSHTVSDLVSFFHSTGCQICTAQRQGEVSGQIAPTAREGALLCDNRKALDSSLVGSFVSGSTLYMRRSFYDAMGGFDLRLRLLEDYPFVIKVLLSGQRIWFWDQIAIVYGEDGISASSRRGKKSPMGTMLAQDYRLFYKLWAEPALDRVSNRSCRRYLQLKKTLRQAESQKERLKAYLPYPDITLLQLKHKLLPRDKGLYWELSAE